MKQARRAFTLIELLVVIAIIGLLAGIVLVALNGARVASRDTKRVADLREIQTALELYYSDNGAYPSAAACGTAAESTVGGSYSACWTTFLPTQYIAKMPVDPLNIPNVHGYYYASEVKPTGNCSFVSTGSLNDYMIGTQLENPSVVPNSCPGGVSAWLTTVNYIVGM